jgi:hypothetical protein
MSDALAGTSDATLAASMEHLESVRNNLRDMIGGMGSERAKHNEHADGR